MLPGRENIQPFFGVAVTTHRDNERVYSILVARELNNIIAGRAMFQSRKFNASFKNASKNPLLGLIVMINRTLSSMIKQNLLSNDRRSP